MSIIQDKLRAPGVPFWVTMYLYLVIAIGVVLGTPALLGSGLMELHTVGWGGRELGVAVGAILAALYRSPTAYVVIFVIGTFRETSDALEALAETPPNMISAALIGGFILMGLLCAWFSYRATRT
jgi:hypothetical protein